MDLLRTDKETLTTAEIEQYIKDHEFIGTSIDSTGAKDRCAWLWRYFKGKNKTIVDKPAPDPNNPDNRTPVPYGRKIVTTFTGYAYRPKFITYKVDDEAHQAYMDQLQATFDLNREHIKTERAGRNTGIYGYAYELLYVEGATTQDATLPVKAEPQFFPIDPIELILIYDYSPEPKKQLAIRYYRITDDYYRVELYEKQRVKLFDRKRSAESGKWIYNETGEYINFFEDIPVVAYYMGDDRLGIIEPVLALIDDYDQLTSDSMNEMERFANAYLLLVKYSISTPELKKEAGAFSRALQYIKQRRVFENLPSADAVRFLTKDIPTAYIEFMAKNIREQIHIQSHVPDFKELATGTLSGAAIKRLMFDFENVVSSAEADFDEGLLDRIRLINTIYRKAGREVDEAASVVITHKRNMPDDLKEAAETATYLKNAGFSSWLIADSMPDSTIPDVELELERQKQERESFVDIESMIGGEGEAEEETA